MNYNFELFNAITDALRLLEQATKLLIAAQQNAENIYMEEKE